MSDVRLEYLPADVLGLDPWAAKVLASRPEPPSLPGMIVPSTVASVPRREDTFEGEERDALATKLEESLLAFAPHVHVLDSVRRLRTPGSFVVMAGQQPGFLGGPLYNAYKALTAVALARALEEAWQTPVVPAFWNHADDHDIAEVHHLWIQNPNLDLRKIGLAGVSSGRTRLSRIRFDAERSRLASIEEVLRQNLAVDADPARREEAIALFLPRDGESFSNAFTRVMLELFGELGLVVFEPDHVREPLSRALARIVPCDLAATLRAGGEALRAAGSDVPIDADQAALLFRDDDGKRRALRSAGEEFRYDGEEGSRTASELAAEIVQEPEPWSAGALLRPLVQDATFPVVAYVGGWGELAYHAQLPLLRDRAGVPRTAFVPRLSATVLDAAAHASLRKLDLDVADALRARGNFDEEEEDEGEDPAAARLRAAAARAAAIVRDERKALAEVDRGLAQQLKKVAGQLETQMGKIADKASRVRANVKGGAGRHRRRLENVLYPRGAPQERVLGTLPVVARHGRDWISELAGEIDALPTEHLVITLGQGGDAS